jgi:hypothetical protein
MAWISSNESADFFMHDAMKSAAELGKTRELAREMARGCAREQGRFRVRLKSFLAEVAASDKHGSVCGIIHLLLAEAGLFSRGRKNYFVFIQSGIFGFANLAMAQAGRVSQQR